jgi:hypothetical protein
MYQLPPFHLSVAIGLIISDVGLEFSKYKGKIASCRLRLEMAYKSVSFLLATFLILSPFCSALPVLNKRIRSGSLNTSVAFYTRSLPCFLELSELFFFNGSSVKEISPLLFYYFDPIVLAYWVMCDGSVHTSGFLFCTDSFSKASIQILVCILINKFDLACSIHVKRKAKCHYRIYIPARSMERLRTIVRPHMHPSFYYKLGL